MKTYHVSRNSKNTIKLILRDESGKIDLIAATSVIAVVRDYDKMTKIKQYNCTNLGLGFASVQIDDCQNFDTLCVLEILKDDKPIDRSLLKIS